LQTSARAVSSVKALYEQYSGESSAGETWRESATGPILLAQFGFAQSQQFCFSAVCLGFRKDSPKYWTQLPPLTMLSPLEAVVP